MADPSRRRLRRLLRMRFGFYINSLPHPESLTRNGFILFNNLAVTPAKAGVHVDTRNPRQIWIPAFAGMTRGKHYPFDSSTFISGQALRMRSAIDIKTKPHPEEPPQAASRRIGHESLNYICRSLEKSQKSEPAKNMITTGATNTSFDRVLSFNEGKKYFSKILTKNMHIYSRKNHIKLSRKY